MANFETPEEELELDIVVTVQDGEVIGVSYMGNEVRALVIDYDVVFPCVAAGIFKDEDGDYYKAIVV